MKLLFVGFLGLAAVVAILGLLLSIETVSPGEVGVLTHWGKPSDTILPPGLHFVNPLGASVHAINVSVQKLEVEAEAASTDLQTVTTKVALNYQIQPKSAIYVYQELGNEVQQRIIDPSVHEAMKAVTARYTAEQLISKRQEVRDFIISDLKERLERSGVEIKEFSIMNFAFSPEFNKAIEQKTVAEQLKDKATNDLARIKVEAEQSVVRGKAEADNLSLQKAQITPELIQLRQLEVSKAAIEKWNGVLPTMLTGGTMPFINVKQQ